MLTIKRTLNQPRSSRDLRAEMLALAASLADNPKAAKGRLIVDAPVMSTEKIRHEWQRCLNVLDEHFAQRMVLELAPAPAPSTAKRLLKDVTHREKSDNVLLERPNLRHEILRQLVNENLQHQGMGLASFGMLMHKIGISETPVRKTLQDFKKARIVASWGRGGYGINLDALTPELLAKLGALPQTLRFRYERGSQIRPAAKLLDRATELLTSTRQAWQPIALSGVAVAMNDVPGIDLMGLPRLDLVARVARKTKYVDTSFIRMLDDGLELEPNPHAQAPVVVTLLHASEDDTREEGIHPVRVASKGDVYLSLLEMGLREQAAQYRQGIL